MSPYVYMVQCADDSYYTGWTVDLHARVEAHQAGKGARYTRSRLPVRLVYWEQVDTQSEALRREARLRRLPHREKSALVREFASPSR